MKTINKESSEESEEVRATLNDYIIGYIRKPKPFEPPDNFNDNNEPEDFEELNTKLNLINQQNKTIFQKLKKIETENIANQVSIGDITFIGKGLKLNQGIKEVKGMLKDRTIKNYLNIYNKQKILSKPSYID